MLVLKIQARRGLLCSVLVMEHVSKSHSIVMLQPLIDVFKGSEGTKIALVSHRAL